ncbi:hypothetical protein [Dactylosporangium sp. NPDC005555]|uniref:hypothetical protein n=1 Tax=Dactylosporangium sp. NPDC005555 TaxID=3154889 RepID=UPI0033AE4A20
MNAHPRSRAAAAVLTVAVMSAVLGAGLSSSWSQLSRQRGLVAAERAGVAYLEPLTALVGALTTAGSGAARGEPLDAGPLHAAAAEVAAADTAHGALLGTGPRWSELRRRIGALTGGPGGYQDLRDAAGLATELATQVGDASHLVLDAELDVYYLTDAGLRLPAVMSGAARVADLVALPPGTGAAASGDADERAAAVAVARYEVAVAVAAISTGLRKSAQNTTLLSTGTDLTGQQDAFQTAVDTLTPPALVRDLSGQVTPAGSADAAARVGRAAAGLAAAIWDRLDTLLADRQAGLVRQQRLVMGGAATVPAGALVLLWLFAPGRRSHAADDDAGGDAGGTEPEAPQISLIDARDLLGAEELVHVGRAVRPRPREHDGAR